MPLRHQFLYRNKVVGSAWALPRADADRLWSNLGWTLQPGTDLPDVDRCCEACGATWVGTRDETCQWCERTHQALLDGQRTLVMAEPETVDVLDGPDDEIQRAIEAWAARLRVAVKAELVTEFEADRVIDVYVKKVESWRSGR